MSVLASVLRFGIHQKWCQTQPDFSFTCE